MRIIKGKVTWVDIAKPTRDDLDFLKKQHDFHPIILDELLHFSSRSRVEFYKDYLFLTYHLPIYDSALKTSRRAEIDFLITKDMVITVRYEELEPVENFYRTVSNNSNFKDKAMGHDTGRLAYYIIQEIIAFAMRQLAHVKENISFITQEIFKGREEAMLEKISYAKRDIMDYSIISRPQEILLDSFLDVGSKFWNEDAKIYLSDLVGDYDKATQLLENYRQVIDSLEDTNGQLLSAKTNRVMQRFTILAFLTFPLLFFTSLLAVDFIADFVTVSPARFWLIFVGVIGLVVALLAFFRKKGWL